MCLSKRRVPVALIGVTLLSALSSAYVFAAEPAVTDKLEAALVEPIEGSSLKRVTLTPKAAERLAIKTTKVTSGGSGGVVTPYSSLVYDVNGAVWVYTNPEPLSFVRHPVVVEAIKGEQAFLKEGPSAGTTVVAVGAAELFGAESGVGH